MKPYNLLFLILLTIYASPSQCQETAFDTTELANLFDPQQLDHILLIGFEDQTINRVQNISASYRRRGSNYKSSVWSKQITTQIGKQYSLQKITEWPMTEVSMHCAVYLVPAGQSVEEAIVQLAHDSRIQIVQKMQLFKTRTHYYSDPYYKLQSNMHDMQIDLAHKISTGQNVAIAIIDTGIDLHHPDLEGQIEFDENFAFGISPGFSNDLHGTAVAGVIAARSDNEQGIIGVAPNARLTALKACWPSKANSFAASCNSYTLALAINKAIKLGVKILNMSLTGPKDPILEILLNKAIEKGIIVVAADPGFKNNAARFPASLQGVIYVQTIHAPNADKNTINQSIIAPGEDVLTTIPGTYDFISGSSLAAAQVSGIVALLLELKPKITLIETNKILRHSVLASCCEPKKEASHGIINANLAVMELCDKQICPRNH